MSVPPTLSWNAGQVPRPIGSRFPSAADFATRGSIRSVPTTSASVPGCSRHGILLASECEQRRWDQCLVRRAGASPPRRPPAPRRRPCAPRRTAPPACAVPARSPGMPLRRATSLSSPGLQELYLRNSFPQPIRLLPPPPASSRADGPDAVLLAGEGLQRRRQQQLVLGEEVYHEIEATVRAARLRRRNPGEAGQKGPGLGDFVLFASSHVLIRTVPSRYTAVTQANPTISRVPLPAAEGDRYEAQASHA